MDGPIREQKLFFFGSYQGTRQINGLAAGQARVACTAILRTPPLTNDRSGAALGKLFGGMKGELGGIAVNPNGSNINPAALALLNFKLPDGSFLIPTPQIIDRSKSFAVQGLSVFIEPCQFAENQFLANLDYVASAKSRFAGRFFLANDSDTVTFPGNGLSPLGNIPGFPSPNDSGFRVFSLEDREYRAWEGSGFAEDDYRISKSLTSNKGLRYERFGQFGDRLGRNSSFDFSKADKSPPPDGSLDGYVVASNFSGALPPGVIRTSNTFGNYGEGVRPEKADIFSGRQSHRGRGQKPLSLGRVRGGNEADEAD